MQTDFLSQSTNFKPHSSTLHTNKVSPPRMLQICKPHLRTAFRPSIACFPIPRFSSTMNPQPRFSKGTDEATATSTLTPLLSTSGGRWTLTSDGEALERSFKFKTFAKAWVR